MNRLLNHALTAAGLLVLLALPALAQAPEDILAKESEEAAALSAKDKATPELIIQKVNDACALLQKEGAAAFPKFKGKNSPFIFSGTYIWIHDMDAVMLMHPIKPKMETQSFMGMKDPGGKLFFAEFNTVAKEKGSGWVDYLWPKPGEDKPSLKVSYVKLCRADGKEVVVGCGVYDMSQEDMQKVLK